MMVSQVNPSFNIEDVHRHVLDEVIEEFKLTALTADDRESSWRKWHALETWADVLPRWRGSRPNTWWSPLPF
jgi:hypothetical protein